MNTLLFTLEYPPFKGGVAHYYKNLVEHYPESDNIFVLDNNNGELLSAKIKPSWLISFSALVKKIKKHKIKHVLVGHVLPLGTVTYLLSKVFDFKYSVILHGMDFTFMQKKKRKKYLGSLILKNAESIFCGNTYVLKLVLEFLGEEFKSKIVVVNPGVSTNVDFQFSNVEYNKELIKKYNLQGQFVLFSIGRLVERKGFDRVIEVMNDLNRDDIKYVLIGDGPNREILEKKIANNKNILFINEKITDEEKNAWFDICNAFIMPSRNINGDFEGFGIVYLEANQHSKPVIAGKSGGVPDAVVDGLNGLLIDPENNEEIKKAIIKLLENKDLCKKMGKQGRDRVLKECSWDEQIKKISKNL